MNLFVCAVITLASLYYIFFFPAKSTPEKKNAPRLSPRAQRSRLRNLRDLNFEYKAGKCQTRTINPCAPRSKKKPPRSWRRSRDWSRLRAVGVSCKSPQRRKKEERNAHEESAHPGRIVRTIALSLGLVRNPGRGGFSASAGKRSITSYTASRASARHGHPPLEGLWQHAGNLVTDAACLRSRTGPQGREQNQSPPPAHATIRSCGWSPRLARSTCSE